MSLGARTEEPGQSEDGQRQDGSIPELRHTCQEAESSRTSRRTLVHEGRPRRVLESQEGSRRPWGLASWGGVGQTHSCPDVCER